MTLEVVQHLREGAYISVNLSMCVLEIYVTLSVVAYSIACNHPCITTFQVAKYDMQ